MAGNSNYYYLGIAVGIVAGIILVMIAAINYRKKTGKCEYDERQERARGKAYKYGFFTLMVYLLIYGTLQDITEVYWGKGLVGVSFGICISVAVFAVISIWNDAYFSLRENPRRFTVLFVAVAVLNLSTGMRHIVHSEGLTDYNILNLFMGVTALVILAAMGAKALKNRREKEEDER